MFVPRHAAKEGPCQYSCSEPTHPKESTEIDRDRSASSMTHMLCLEDNKTYGQYSGECMITSHADP